MEYDTKIAIIAYAFTLFVILMGIVHIISINQKPKQHINQNYSLDKKFEN